MHVSYFLSCCNKWIGTNTMTTTNDTETSDSQGTVAHALTTTLCTSVLDINMLHTVH